MNEDDLFRIDRLEIRLAEQDAVIEDLNTAITAQWRTIDALKRAVAQLEERVEAASAEAPAGSQKPPHY